MLARRSSAKKARRSKAGCGKERTLWLPRNSTQRRAARVRRQIKKVAGDRPRLSVHRSSKNIYAQIIDDAKGHTLAAASTLDERPKGGSRPAPTPQPLLPSAS